MKRTQNSYSTSASEFRRKRFWSCFRNECTLINCCMLIFCSVLFVYFSVVFFVSIGLLAYVNNIPHTTPAHIVAMHRYIEHRDVMGS